MKRRVYIVTRWMDVLWQRERTFRHQRDAEAYAEALRAKGEIVRITTKYVKKEGERCS